MLDILYEGLLRIRMLAISGNTRACFDEADHLHNLPELLRSNQREELVRFYSELERPSFQSASAHSVEAFEPLWARLDALMKADSA
jgi:hypothetical protein